MSTGFWEGKTKKKRESIPEKSWISYEKNY